MPPKKAEKKAAEPEPAPEVDESSGTIISIKVTVNDNESNKLRDIKVRIFSKWANCCMITNEFGFGSLSWDGIESPEELKAEENLRSATFKTKFTAKFSTESELESINADPYIYAVLLAENADGKSVPTLFAAVDCSSGLVRPSAQSNVSEKYCGTFFELKVDTKERMISDDLLVPLEPVSIDLQSVCHFPLQDTNPLLYDNMVNRMYVFSRVNIDGFERMIYIRKDVAKLPAHTASSTANSSRPKTSDEMGDSATGNVDCNATPAAPIEVVDDPNAPFVLEVPKVEEDKFVDTDSSDDERDLNKTNPLFNASNIDFAKTGISFNHSGDLGRSRKNGTAQSRVSLNFDSLKAQKDEVSQLPKELRPEPRDLGDSVPIPVNYSMLLLPGLKDLNRFKEYLNSMTFNIEVHTDDLRSRVFDDAMCTDFICIMDGRKSRAQRASIVGEDNIAPATSGADIATFKSTSIGPICSIDEYLLTVIHKGLECSAKIGHHGIARMRVERLLSRAEDLLAEFAHNRQTEKIENETVVVKDSVQYEVKMERPSKPIPWTMPADLSLKNSLAAKLAKEAEIKAKLKAEQDAAEARRLGRVSITSGRKKRKTPRSARSARSKSPRGKSRGSTAGSKPGSPLSPTWDFADVADDPSSKSPEKPVSIYGMATTRKKPSRSTVLKQKPVYERYGDCRTTVVMAVNLHRSLKHPEPVPKVTNAKTVAKVQSALATIIGTQRMSLLSKNAAKAKEEAMEAEVAAQKALLAAEANPVEEEPQPRGSTKPKKGEKNDKGTKGGKGSRPTSGAAKKEEEKVEVASDPEPRNSVTSNTDDSLTGRPSVGTFTNVRLKNRLAVTPFTRMVFVFRYRDNESLRNINAAIAKVNKAALPDIQGSLQSYAFTDSEKASAKDAQLDVVTGFTIIDNDQRIIVIEGLAGPNQGMQSIWMDLKRTKANDKDYKLLCNPEVLFPDRIYTDYNADMKRIRVREKLKILARKPEFYNRHIVADETFTAVDKLMQLVRAEDMHSTKIFDMYPSTESLSLLERLYGEAISIQDMFGKKSKKRRKHSTTGGDDNGSVRSGRSARSARSAGSARSGASYRSSKSGYTDATGRTGATSKSGRPSSTGSGQTGTGSRRSHGSRKDGSGAGKPAVTSEEDDDDEDDSDDDSMGSLQPPRKGPTDCRNPDYEQWLRDRPEHRYDRLAEQRELRRQAWEEMLMRKDENTRVCQNTLRETFGEAGMNQKIYTYSTQTNNYKIIALNSLKRQLGKEKNATYTYNRDFSSQTLNPYDIDEKGVSHEKDAWLTKGGFQYPKPKSTADLLAHPKKPTDIRIEDLKEAWEEPNVSIPGVAVKERPNEDPRLRALELGYSTRMKSMAGDFGNLSEPVFEHDFQLRLIGDKTHLPRGKLVGGRGKNRDFFKSVHLVGDEAAKIIAEAQQKEKDDWNAKVVVDGAFKVGGFHVRDTPIQIDRCNDILKDEPKTHALKDLRTKKSVKGKDIGYKTAPIRIMSEDPYVDNEQAKNTMKTLDESLFITAKDLQSHASETDGSDAWKQRPVDFNNHIHPDEHAPRLVRHLAKKKHPAMDPREKVGPKWEPALEVMKNR